MNYFLDSVFYSYAQIFFSNRKWFGALILAASMVNPLLGVSALLGLLASNSLAVLLHFDREKIRIGMYGFNGILFGAALTFYYQLSVQLLWLMPVFFLVVFFVSVVLEHHLEQVFNLPGLSLPFVVTVYVFVIFIGNYTGFSESAFVIRLNSGEGTSLYEAFLKSMALIIFQPDVIAGILLLTGLLLFSRVLFLLSIFGFAVNALFLSLLLPLQYDSLLVLTGFNAILTSFALGGSLIIPSRKNIPLVIIAIMMVIVLTGFFVKAIVPAGLPILVLPFNLIVLLTLYSLRFRKDQTDLVLLYFKPGSPEENHYYHKKRTLRFQNFKLIYPELPFFGEWVVSQGFHGQYTHKGDWKYAFDFKVLGADGKEFDNDGLIPEDYYCYNLPVTAPLDGTIVRIVEGVPENQIGDANIRQNWGNTVIISHKFDLFSSVSHLKADSIKVKEGDKVTKGDIIGRCGNSGRSPYPHLHFQFQASDTLGDATFLFPFSNFIVRDGDKLRLKSFSYPEEGNIVQNIDIHKTIQQGFRFRLGEKFMFNVTEQGRQYTENWEVKVDIWNQLYIESSNGSIAELFITEKVFYFTSYIGEKTGALYAFYLAAMQVPYCYHEKLQWEDEYSVAQLPGMGIRYLSEFFLLWKDMISARGLFRFIRNEATGEFTLHTSISVKGTSLFRMVQRALDGNVIIDSDGDVTEISLYDQGKEICNAKLIKERNNHEKLSHV